MNINVQHGLPFVQISVQFRGKQLLLQKVLLDTGSAGTIFNADLVGTIGVIPEENDVVDTIRGVGGIEYVYTKRFDAIHFGNVCLNNFLVEIGRMEYGMEIDGIIGFDFINAAELVIDTKKLLAYLTDSTN
jgi:hypothetical protein